MENDAAALSSSSGSTMDPEEAVSSSSSNGDSVEVVLDSDDSQPAFSESSHEVSEEECSEEDHPPSITSTTVLQSIPGNQKCFDCNIENPLWVDMSYCVFLCAACATIHSEFGLQAKPLSDHCLTVGDLTLLSKTGNKVAGLYWLANWGHDKIEYLHAHAPKDVRTKFIIAKYRGKWLHPQDKAALASVQHAFSPQPEYYGPSHDSTQTQQFSSHSQGSYGSTIGMNGGNVGTLTLANGYHGANGNGDVSTYTNGSGGPNNHLPGYVQAPSHNNGLNNGYHIYHDNNAAYGSQSRYHDHNNAAYGPQPHYHDHNNNNNNAAYGPQQVSNNHHVVNSQGMANGTNGNGVQHGTNRNNGSPYGKEPSSNPNYVMNNTAAYSKRGRAKQRQSY